MGCSTITRGAGGAGAPPFRRVAPSQGRCWSPSIQGGCSIALSLVGGGTGAPPVFGIHMHNIFIFSRRDIWRVFMQLVVRDIACYYLRYYDGLLARIS